MVKFSSTYQLTNHECSDPMERHGVYQNRWADIQFDGTLSAIDEGIEFMIQCATRAGQGQSGCEEALDDLEGSALATTRRLSLCLSLNPNRPVKVPFDAGLILGIAVSQYVFKLPKIIRRTIAAGANLAQRCYSDALQFSELLDVERRYVEWATPCLLLHLIGDPCHYGEE